MNMFIVDDHPLMVNIYGNIISNELSHLRPIIVKSHSCKEAYHQIQENSKIDFAIVDYNQQS
jgi:DNA-binding NarL/FixJ family response regulator